MIVISPDNPSGSHLKYGEVIELLDISKKMNKQIIFDESFIDFANNSYTLIDDDILNKYPNLIVIKSISKSYGVPGLRLGVLASGNNKYLDIINRNMPVIYKSILSLVNIVIPIIIGPYIVRLLDVNLYGTYNRVLSEFQIF